MHAIQTGPSLHSGEQSEDIRTFHHENYSQCLEVSLDYVDGYQVNDDLEYISL